MQEGPDGNLWPGRVRLTDAVRLGHTGRRTLREYTADKIVAEVNYGGDMEMATIEGI